MVALSLAVMLIERRGRERRHLRHSGCSSLKTGNVVENSGRKNATLFRADLSLKSCQEHIPWLHPDYLRILFCLWVWCVRWLANGPRSTVVSHYIKHLHNWMSFVLWLEQKAILKEAKNSWMGDVTRFLFGRILPSSTTLLLFVTSDPHVWDGRRPYVDVSTGVRSWEVKE